MKKFLVLCAVAGLMSFSAHAQEDLTGLTTSVSTSMQRSYIRPTLTRIYVTDGSMYAVQYAQLFAEQTPTKYNYIEVKNKFFSVSEIPADMNEYLAQVLEGEKVSNQIMHGWFPEFDSNRGAYSTKMLLEMGRYAMTDEDVLAANSSSRSMETFATTFGKELIDRSYVVCYLMTQYTDKEGKPAGVNITPYVYKLDYGPKVATNFQRNYFKKATGIDECEFPLIHVLDAKKSTTGSISEDSLSIEEDFDNAMVLVRDIADFQVKATIVGTHPITAKIGKKEGLYVDKRFNVVRLEEELVTDEEGNETTRQVAKRRAFVRAKKVADNTGLATGETEALSSFYKIRGLGVQEGYTLVENADMGLGVSVDLAFAHPSVTVDYRLGRYTKIPGLLAYIKAGLPLATQIGGGLVYNAAIGVGKEINFAPFTLTPSVDAGMLRASIGDESLDLGYTASLNAKFGVYVAQSVQIYATLGYVALISQYELDHMPINIGVGFKVGF